MERRKVKRIIGEYTKLATFSKNERSAEGSGRRGAGGRHTRHMLARPTRVGDGGKGGSDTQRGDDKRARGRRRGCRADVSSGPRGRLLEGGEHRLDLVRIQIRVSVF